MQVVEIKIKRKKEDQHTIYGVINKENIENLRTVPFLKKIKIGDFVCLNDCNRIIVIGKKLNKKGYLRRLSDDGKMILSNDIIRGFKLFPQGEDDLNLLRELTDFKDKKESTHSEEVYYFIPIYYETFTQIEFDKDYQLISD